MTDRGARTLLGVALGTLFTFYFLQTLTAPPNSDDGGIVLGYIHRISRGERVYFDFVDYYGPLTYRLPALAYALAGERAIGVGVFLVILKLATLAAAYHAVRVLSSRFHAVLAVVALGVLLGLPWPMFQIPYAHHSTLPLVLLTAAWVLAPGELTRARIAGAGVATVAMLWMKVSIGAFVLSAVVFYLFHFLPDDRAGEARAQTPRAERLVYLAARGVVVAIYGLVFQAFIQRHFDRMYFAYLTGPLAIALAVTLVDAVRTAHGAPVRRRLRAAGLYLGTTTALWAALLLLFFGPREAIPYLAQQIEILSRMRLVSGFAPVGLPGLFRGFGEHYWAELPWLFTLAYAAWIAAWATGRARRVFGAAFEAAHARVTGTFLLVTLHTYVIYSVPDDAHMMQALLLVVPFLFVLFFHLERLVAPSARESVGARVAVGLTTLTYCSTQVFGPDPGAFRPGAGDWGNPHLAHLRYHPEWSSFANPVDPRISDRILDRDLDDAARMIDRITDDGEEILVLAAEHLLYYASNTVPAPRRYGHFLYLLGHERFRRPDFDALVPADVRRRFLEEPPRVVVEVTGHRQILDAFPELERSLHGGKYAMVGRWGVLRVYARDAG